MTTEPPKLERKLTRSDNFGNKYLKAVSLPVAWYDLDALNPNTVHHEKPLKLTLILIHIVGLAAFVGQCAYHYLDTIKETTVMAKDVDGVSGWSCKTLVPDPIYSLNMSYNECMKEHYVKPTVENLVRYGLFGPLVFSGFDGGQPEDSYDGP